MDDVPPPPEGFTVQDDVPPPPQGFKIDARLSNTSEEKAVQRPPAEVRRGIGETVANVASAAAAFPVAATASIYELLTAPPGTRAHAASQASQRVQQAMTYQPKTPAGKAMSGVANYPAQKLGEFGTWLADKTAEKTGNEGLAAVAAMVPQAAAVLLGKEVPGMVAKGIGKTEASLARAKVANAPIDSAAQATFNAGFKIAPGEVGGPIAQTIQAVAGGAKLEKEVSAFNAGRVQEVAKVDLKMHPDEVLDREMLDTLRTREEAPYEALRATGTVTADPQYMTELANTGSQFAKIEKEFPSEKGIGLDWEAIEREKGKYFQPSFMASGAIDAMRQLRKDARTNLKVYDPQKNALGLVQRQIADALLNQLDRHAGTLGKPQLVQQFRDARVQLAKIQAVDDAMVGDTVSADLLARLYDNGRGRLLTGGLKTIADAATRFKKSFQKVNPQEWHGYLSSVDYFMGLVGAIHSAPLAAVAFGRPVARAIMRSNPVQKSLAKTPSYKVGPVRRVVKKVGEHEGAAAAATEGTAAIDAEDEE